MSRFNKRRATPLARGVFTIKKGVALLQEGNFDGALRQFRSVAASNSTKTTRLVKGVAAFYCYNTERIRKESKKARIGNGHLIDFTAVNGRNAWSDVDIAAVLVAPTSPFANKFLAAVLGRTEEAIRFQRRYTFDSPLNSWTSEKGTKYTRFTQTRKVASALGISS